jgi:hypothetical protein
MPQEYQSLPAVSCEIREWNEPWGGKFLFPFMLNGKSEKIVFDTGSSIFPLITPEKTRKKPEKTVDKNIVWCIIPKGEIICMV